MQDDKAKNRDQQIQKLQSICGCTSGAVVAILFLLSYILILLSSSLPGRMSIVMQIGFGILIMLTGTLIGKVSAITYARIRLKKLSPKVLTID